MWYLIGAQFIEFRTIQADPKKSWNISFFRIDFDRPGSLNISYYAFVDQKSVKILSYPMKWKPLRACSLLLPKGECEYKIHEKSHWHQNKKNSYPISDCDFLMLSNINYFCIIKPNMVWSFIRTPCMVRYYWVILDSKVQLIFKACWSSVSNFSLSDQHADLTLD